METIRIHISKSIVVETQIYSHMSVLIAKALIDPHYIGQRE